jgi:hypothetical protein
MDIQDFNSALRHCKESAEELYLPSDESIKELQVGMKLTWPERLDLRYILRKYADDYRNKRTNDFYQEYFHIVISPEGRPIKDEYIKVVPMELIRKDGVNWLHVRFPTGEKIFPVNIYLGTDPASSLEANAKYSVIMIVCMNQYRQIFFFGYSRGHYSLRDVLRDGEVNLNGDMVMLDETKIKRKGIVDEQIRMIRAIRPNAMQIETTQAQYHVYTETLRIMGINDAYCVITEEKPTANKEERDADRLVPYFQSGNAFVNEGMGDFILELKSFPKGTTIDAIDAAYHALANARPPDGAVFTAGNSFFDKYRIDKESEIETDFDALL